MKKRISLTSVFSFAFLIGVGIFFSYIHTQSLYTDYRNHWDYRRLKPDILPSPQTIQFLAAGHDTTYAGVLWIQLIQFIGDNIRDSRYLDFTHEILTRIHFLHPRFARPYEVDLLFLPSISSRDPADMITKKQEKLNQGIAYYESILPKVCDITKIHQIEGLPFGVELWERQELKNPCLSGYIPYYLATKYDIELNDRYNAARYYKIASMHDDAPSISKYLGLIAFASDGNYRDSALTLALMATEAYDEEPHQCHNLALQIIKDISDEVESSWKWIENINQQEKKLTSPTSTNNPLVLMGSTCYENLQRSIKQLYLGYITQISSKYTDIDSGKELVELGILPYIPTIQAQSGFTVVKKQDVWKYVEFHN